MKMVEKRNVAAGCLALLLLAGGGYWLMTRDPGAGERSGRAAVLRDACIDRGRAAFRAAHHGADMTPKQAADLVARCFGEARRQTE